MEMVEDMEKCILSLLLVYQILDIIYYKGVDTLVEIDELIDFTVAGGYRELALEQAGAHIEYAARRIVLKYLDADCLDEMRLAHTGRSENEQRVESLAFGVAGYGLADSHGNLVGGASAIILESVAGIELRIERGGRGSLEKTGGLALERRRKLKPGLIDHCVGLVVDLKMMIVKTFERLSVDPAQSRHQYRQIGILDMLHEERGGHGQRQLAVLIFKRCHRLEPGIVLLGADIIADYPQTLLPQAGVVCIHLQKQFIGAGTRL